MKRKIYDNDVVVNAYAEVIRGHAIRLNEVNDLDPLMDRMGDAKIVLLGEASHGTHEYYTWRACISQRLIEGKNFSFIGVTKIIRMIEAPHLFHCGRNVHL